MYPAGFNVPAVRASPSTLTPTAPPSYCWLPWQLSPHSTPFQANDIWATPNGLDCWHGPFNFPYLQSVCACRGRETPTDRERASEIIHLDVAQLWHLAVATIDSVAFNSGTEQVANTHSRQWVKLPVLKVVRTWCNPTYQSRHLHSCIRLMLLFNAT